MSKWFELRGKINSSLMWILTLLGFCITVAVWWVLAEAFSETRPVVDQDPAFDQIELQSLTPAQRDSLARADSLQLAKATKFVKVYPIVPRPDKVLLAFQDLFTKDKLVNNVAKSLWLNVQGYFWAILISLPLGFLLGLFPLFRSLFSRQVDALRYLPLSALTGLFIIWFGLGDPMKIAFLAVGIIVYLIPVVVQRIWDVEEVYVQTAYTMGASKWQMIKNVFLPGVFSRLMDDIRVLTAISWTYIIIAELLNKETGIGSLIYTKARQGQLDRVFALLLVIIGIGLIQDKIFALMDKIINPHKYYKSVGPGLQEGKIGVLAVILAIVLGILCQYILNISMLCTVGWIVFAAGLIAMIYSYFLLEKIEHHEPKQSDRFAKYH